MRKKDIFISPAKSIINEIFSDMDVIICTSDKNLVVPERGNVLLLRFDDITDGTRSSAFSMQHAERICSFVTRDLQNDTLFVCCDSGVSRSSAIAAALTIAMGDDDLCIWSCPDYSPNTFVFRLMCEALCVRIEQAAVDLRKRINEDALHDAVTY